MMSYRMPYSFAAVASGDALLLLAAVSLRLSRCRSSVL